MGGSGSGRQTERSCTEDWRRIDVRRLQRDGSLDSRTSFRWQWVQDGECKAAINVDIAEDMTLRYRYRVSGGDWNDVAYSVPLDWTLCNFGGKRAWFLCPSFRCRRRVAILYLGIDGMFACRHCHQLAYRCQREAMHDSLMRRADKIRERLDWEPGALNGGGFRPKGMHLRTFDRLSAEHDRLVASSISDFMKRYSEP